MDGNSPESQPAKEPMPSVTDTEKLGKWMKVNIIRPPKGYDAMKHPDGKPFNEDEQIDAYVDQTIDVIEFFKQQNRPESAYEDVKQAILGLTQPEKS